MSNIANKLIDAESLIEILIARLKECDEAMDYMSEYDIPLCLPENVKKAIAAYEEWINK